MLDDLLSVQSILVDYAQLRAQPTNIKGLSPKEKKIMAKNGKAEFLAKVAAAKAPVQEHLAMRETILAALAEHDAKGEEVIKNLIDVAGQTGPFKFAQGEVTFRKNREAAGYSYSEPKEAI